MITVRPKFLQAVFIKKGGRQVSLWIEVGSNDSHPEVGIHPCQVIHKRGFPDSAFIIKKRDESRAHGRLLTMTNTWASSTMNSGGGLPFFWSSLRASGIPTPNR